MMRTSFFTILLLVLHLGIPFSTKAQQESLADLSRRVRAEKEQKARQEKSIDVYKGRLTITATPKFADARNQSINRIWVEVQNSSRRDYRYVFTAKCGEWSKKISSNIKGLSEKTIPEEEKLAVMQRELNLMQAQYYSDPNVELREETFRDKINKRTQEIEQQKVAVEKAKQAIADLEIDLPSPCDWSAVTLEDFREAEGLEGPEPQPSKMPGIDDAELARQATVQRVVIVEAPPSPANSFESALDRAIDVLTSTNAALAGAHVCTAAAFELLKQVAPQTLDVFRRVEAFNSSDIAAALVLAPPSLRARVNAKLDKYIALAERSHELQDVVLRYTGKCP